MYVNANTLNPQNQQYNHLELQLKREYIAIKLTVAYMYYFESSKQGDQIKKR
ncbi:hypothetical protein Scep_010473 [Stephania cephalantha]|uniref:Uncharacterized protein n=1 Tax=Stephania cephalantha TaxID=152367 RepID=A0AAP0JXK1_9MAGN